MKQISTWWRKYRVVEKDVFHLQTKTLFGWWVFLGYVSNLEEAQKKALIHKNKKSSCFRHFILFFDVVEAIAKEIKAEFVIKKDKIHKL